MTISFRTRLFVVSGVIVTAVITAVMLIGWSRVLAFEADRLEQRLCMEAKRLATQPMHDGELQRSVNDILGKLHLSSPEQVMLYVKTRAAGDGFQTSNWRPEFALDSAPWRNVSVVGAEGLERNAQDDSPPRPPRALQDQQGNQPPPPPPRSAPQRGERAPVNGTCALVSLTALDRPWRAARFTHAQGGSVLAVDLIATQAEIQSALKQALRMVVPLALILTALGAWLLASLTMRPVNRLRGAMQVVTQKALNKRLSSYGEDYEFSVLINAYNTMLSRLEKSFQQASRFSADAAHELKTPLTILQGRIEQSMRQTYDPTAQQDLTDLLDEVGRLSDITRKLLLLSQVDAGYLALQHASINLSEMLGDMAADTQMLLTDQTLQCAIDHDLLIEGDALLLRQLLNNLVSNAVRYCRKDGWIRLSARAVPSGVEVVFANTTQEIAPDERGRFFDRFYRGDASHNRRTDGNGLGLSLAREIARAHGGDLVLTPSASDEVILQLTLPLS